MHYAGIGSRETPSAILEVMAAVGERLAQLGWVLRSGGAVGADQAFERGCDRAGGRKEIVLPWPGFDGHPSPLCTVSAAMLDLAERHHPAWERCRPAARTLLARNGCQVLGPDLATPSRVVIGWAPGGEPVGGTVKWYNSTKGYGFVAPDDGGRDVFVHVRTLESAGLSGLDENQRVRMTVRQGEKGPEASSIHRA